MSKYNSFLYYKDFVEEQVTQVSRKEDSVELCLKIYYGKSLNLKNSANEEIQQILKELPYEQKIIDLNFIDVIKDIPIEGNILFLSQKGKIDSLHESPIFLDFEKDVSDAQEKIIDLIEKELSKKIKLVD